MASLVIGSADLRSLTDPAGTRALLCYFDVSPVRGPDVTATDNTSPWRSITEQHARLRATQREQLAIQEEQTRRMLAIARPARGSMDSARDYVAPLELRWRVLAQRSGTQELEQSYEFTLVSWTAGYALVLSRSQPGIGSLQGWLSVANRTRMELRADNVWVVDAPLRPLPPPLPPPPPRNEEEVSVPPGPAPYRPAPLRLPVSLRVPAGAIAQVPLLPDRVQVATSLARVYDPVGAGLDHPGRRPRSEEEYGASRGRDVLIYAEIAMENDHLHLPPGQLTVYRRGKAALIPLGSATVFAATRETAGAPTRIPARLRLPIGLAPELIGRREQADFVYDPARRRLLEEIRVTLENRGDEITEVVIREHLYRGIDWALVYHNAAEPVEKTGPQELQIRRRVPAHGKVLTAYRVAYTW
jgi:hypothetical protein